MSARAALWPESGATWIDVRGCYAMFDAPDSPLTQTCGIGLFDEMTDADLDTIERFFNERHAPVFHEMCPMADERVVAALGGRGYRPFEFTNVMFRPVSMPIERAVPGPARVRVVSLSEEEMWTQTAAAGWSETPEVESFMRDIGRLTMAREGAAAFVAEVDGAPVATAVLTLHGGVALFAGASTIPTRRRLGAQNALVDARMRFAAEQSCDLAMMGALPGSASQRNAERSGFRVAYTRVKWRSG